MARIIALEVPIGEATDGTIEYATIPLDNLPQRPRLPLTGTVELVNIPNERDPIQEEQGEQ